MTRRSLTFEHPLNERVRIFLRAEYLFQLAHYRLTHLHSTWDVRHYLETIIELYNLLERTEFRGELLKEIERQQTSLQRLSQSAAVNAQALFQTLQELTHAAEKLRSFLTMPPTAPKENELLASVRQRLPIPGGTCSFDLPAFHYWLHLPETTTPQALHAWFEHFSLLEPALSLALRLIRHSSVPQQEVASSGQFQKALHTSLPCQLIRITPAPDSGVYPETSANKHQINIRFLKTNFAQKPTPTAKDVPFELTCCTI